MTRQEKLEMKELENLINGAIDCLVATPPKRGAADYLLSARGVIAELLHDDGPSDEVRIERKMQKIRHEKGSQTNET